MDNSTKVHLLLTFKSVNFAMQAEKRLKEMELEIKTIPTPREISNSCGLSIMTDIGNYTLVQSEKDRGLGIENLWRYEKRRRNSSAERIDRR